jgi:hypothetical protein
MSISPKLLIAILAPILAFMTWIALSVVLLLYGNDWWLSGLLTLTVFAWLAGLLVVVYQQGPVRAAAMGAVIASATYWLLALGPWFSTNVGPTLLTSRLLSHADMLLHGGVPQTQTLAVIAPTPATVYQSGGPYNISGSGAVTWSMPTTTAIAVPAPLAGSVFQPLGHWLFIWLVAALGGFAAFAMQLRAQRKAKLSPSPSTPDAVGESPFGPAETKVATDENSATVGAAP